MMMDDADPSHWFPRAQRVETHISVVLLEGDLAYKFKKPVRLPFLDFSTLAARERFLREELRLNQRTAPGLYLDLLPLPGVPGAPVQDWALRMRRFDAQDLLATMAVQGRLGPAHIDDLAAHVADFHLGLAPLTPSQVPDKDLGLWVSETLEQVAADPRRPEAVALDRVAALRGRLDALMAAQAGWRARRADEGWVREAHGDLHLGNLVLWQGRVVAFDAIEFDPALRCIDVMNDAAFAFMDLLAAGLPRLAWRFISGYVERTGDHGGLVGLRAFAAYRALVRARVALLGGDTDTFLRYWHWVEALAAPPARPRLYLVMGLSGSGKSTAAALWMELLAEAAPAGEGAVRLRSDVERKRLHGLAPTQRPVAGPGHEGAAVEGRMAAEKVGESVVEMGGGVSLATLYGPAATRATYERLQVLAATLLAAGVSVVVDAATLRQAEREALRDVAQAQGADLAVLECVADPALMARRLQQRQQADTDPSDAGVAVLRLQQGFAEPVPADWAPLHRVIENNGDITQLTEALRSCLAALR